MRIPKSPTQLRGKQRVEELLAAADSEIAKVGYDSVTMSQIAKRAGSAIGSLYQFFPSKEAIVRELRMKYCSDLGVVWLSLLNEKFDSIEHFAGQFVGATLNFLETHRSFLALINAPSVTRVPGVAGELEKKLGRVLHTHIPGYAKAFYARKAAGILQVSKAMMMMYASAKRSDRRWIANEFQSVLVAYLVVEFKKLKIRKEQTRKPKRVKGK